MAYFEEAIAGMRKGEKWRMEHWELEEWISFEDRGMGGIAYFSGRNSEKQLPDMEVCKCITGDWERYEEPNKSLTFDEAMGKMHFIHRTQVPQSQMHIKVHSPWGNMSYDRDNARFISYATEFDLAERHGWKIVEVKEDE